MQKPPRVVTFNLGSDTTLDTLRELIEQTKSLSGSARVRFDEELGQRDAIYNTVIITEKDW